MTAIRSSVGLALFAICLGGCANSLVDRSLIFSTHTTLGLEVSVNPADTSGPAKVIVGYKRFEGVVNPVFYDHRAAPRGGKNTTADASDNSNPPRPDAENYYRSRAYSVVAKINGDAGGGAAATSNGKLSIAQWFATGKAADIIAGQPGIAAALVGSADPRALGALETIPESGWNPTLSELQNQYMAADGATKALFDACTKTIWPKASEFKDILAGGNIKPTPEQLAELGNCLASKGISK